MNCKEVGCNNPVSGSPDEGLCFGHWVQKHRDDDDATEEEN